VIQIVVQDGQEHYEDIKKILFQMSGGNLEIEQEYLDMINESSEQFYYQTEAIDPDDEERDEEGNEVSVR
jgi:hypothetical protein